MSLILRDIHKTYGTRQILRGVDLSVEPGEITCLIGPSGAGKTTLLRIMAGLETPDAGALFCEGRGDIVWPDVTVVFQSLFLWPHMTLAENMLLPARMRLNEKELKEDFDRLVAEFGMESFIHRHPNEASLGQRQRVALARAVILRPKYLLLDEITSALDVEQVAAVLNILEGLKSRGIGMLLITHLLNFARRAADKIVFLENGVVGEEGPSSLLASPKSERLRQFVSLVDFAS